MIRLAILKRLQWFEDINTQYNNIFIWYLIIQPYHETPTLSHLKKKEVLLQAIADGQ